MALAASAIAWCAWDWSWDFSDDSPNLAVFWPLSEPRPNPSGWILSRDSGPLSMFIHHPGRSRLERDTIVHFNCNCYNSRREHRFKASKGRVGSKVMRVSCLPDASKQQGHWAARRQNWPIYISGSARDETHQIIASFAFDCTAFNSSLTLPADWYPSLLKGNYRRWDLPTMPCTETFFIKHRTAYPSECPPGKSYTGRCIFSKISAHHSSVVVNASELCTYKHTSSLKSKPCSMCHFKTALHVSWVSQDSCCARLRIQRSGIKSMVSKALRTVPTLPWLQS